MNRRQKEALQASIEDERAVFKALEKNYTTALADVKRNIRELQANPLTQSKAYQLEFQKQLERQISGVLDNLQGKNFTSIAEYLNDSYRNSFIGNMYDMQGQGVPLVIPIDERQVLKAVQKTGDDFKLSNKLGGNTKKLKEQVQQELTRGLATELSYEQIARHISDYGESDMRRSMTIARTEGHRVQNEAKQDSMTAAKEKGADIVKQWDATLDGSTRPEHAELDGQVVELDEDFTVGSYSAPYPGGFGDPYMDCNCRCAMLQRARWAVQGESTYQKWNNETGGLIECSGFRDFKDKYLKALERLKSSENNDTIKFTPVETKTSRELSAKGVEYKEVAVHSDKLTDEEIIHAIAGGDMTIGSCASLALAYAGQKQGWDVQDFRGGDSMEFFAGKLTKVRMFNDLGATTIVSDTAKSSLTNGKRILGQLEENKEYYLSAGRHAAIVRNNNGVLQYLELQDPSPNENGWTNFGDVGDTLKDRFGCSSSSYNYAIAFATDISQLSGDDFRTILGYINTGSSEQKKGAAGSVK